MRVSGLKIGIWDKRNKELGQKIKFFWLKNEIFGMENKVNNQHVKKGLVELKIFVKVIGQKMIFLGQKWKSCGLKMNFWDRK